MIIDEVSMLSISLFELLDYIAKAAKRSDEAFGGIQVILVGDFLQLPPVIVRGEEVTEDRRKFCFQSSTWREAGFIESDGGMVQLEEIIRQKDDRVYVNVLNEVRKGKICEDTVQLLNNCLVTKKPLPSDGIIPTMLYCYNAEVDKINLENLAKLPDAVHVLEATDRWVNKPPTAAVQKTMKESISKSAPNEVELKIGAQVMLTRNSNEKQKPLVNGSRGVVTRFIGKVPVVKFDTGKVVQVRPVEYEIDDKVNGFHIIRTQVPLKLAW